MDGDVCVCVVLCCVVLLCCLCVCRDCCVCCVVLCCVVLCCVVCVCVCVCVRVCVCVCVLCCVCVCVCVCVRERERERERESACTRLSSQDGHANQEYSHKTTLQSLKHKSCTLDRNALETMSESFALPLYDYGNIMWDSRTATQALAHRHLNIDAR